MMSLVVIVPKLVIPRCDLKNYANAPRKARYEIGRSSHAFDGNLMHDLLPISWTCA
jgi:hypothetical protein